MSVQFFDRNALAVRFSHIRRNSGLSQQELARKSGVSQTLISHIERGGRPDYQFSSLIHLALSLDVTLQHVFDGCLLPKYRRALPSSTSLNPSTQEGETHEGLRDGEARAAEPAR